MKVARLPFGDGGRRTMACSPVVKLVLASRGRWYWRSGARWVRWKSWWTELLGSGPMPGVEPQTRQPRRVRRPAELPRRTFGAPQRVPDRAPVRAFGAGHRDRGSASTQLPSSSSASVPNRRSRTSSLMSGMSLLLTPPMLPDDRRAALRRSPSDDPSNQTRSPCCITSQITVEPSGRSVRQRRGRGDTSTSFCTVARPIPGARLRAITRTQNYAPRAERLRGGPDGTMGVWISERDSCQPLPLRERNVMVRGWLPAAAAPHVAP